MNRPESLWAKGDTIRTPLALAFSLWQVPIRCMGTLWSRREAVRYNFDGTSNANVRANAQPTDRFGTMTTR